MACRDELGLVAEVVHEEGHLLLRLHAQPNIHEAEGPDKLVFMTEQAVKLLRSELESAELKQDTQRLTWAIGSVRNKRLDKLDVIFNCEDDFVIGLLGIQLLEICVFEY